jgi:acetoin utilization protein AcuB
VDIAKWMRHPVHSVKPRDSIRHAREMMAEHRINQLPVVVDGRVVGIVTDRDLRDAFPSVFDVARSKAAHEAAPGLDGIVVETVMSTKVLILGPNDSVTAAAQLMRQERIGAVPIVDRGRLVGILTRSDLLDALVALSAATPARTAAARV